MGWILHEAEYRNLVVAGRTASAEPFCLVAGRHQAGFPYPVSPSWDNLLMCVGARRFAVSAAELCGLRLEVDVDGPERGRATVAFAGELDGVRVELDLGLDFLRFDPFQLGKRFNLPDLATVPGLRWRPFQLRGGAGCGTVTIDGVRAPIAALAGELEHGRLTGLRWRRCGFAYDYLCAAWADPAAAAGDWYATVDFQSYALDPSGPWGWLFDTYLRCTASQTVTLGADDLARGNPHGVAAPSRADPSVVLASDVVDLGWATLDRQLVTTRDGAGRALYGLREIFAPTPPAQAG